MTSTTPGTDRTTTGRPRPAVMLLAAALLLTHFLLAVGSKRHESTTSDELPHLTAGFSYWQNHDYRLQPENGVLPQRWAALPTWLVGAKFPPLENNDYWRVSDVWVVGHQFFYETGEDHFPRLMAGRAMIALFSVATGALVFWWSRRLFGEIGGLISLVFFTFSPDFLAHGALVTSDVCMVFFFLAAVGAWWWQLHDGRAWVWWLSAGLFGLALTAKYSAVLLVPMMVLMALARAFNPEPLPLLGHSFKTRAAKFWAAAFSAAGHGVVAAVVIWAFYGFRYSAFNPALAPALQFIRSWEEFEASLGGTGKLIHAARMAHLLPEGYLYGFAYVLETVKMRSAFLNGEYSLTGWPTYFLWTFGLKTTIALMIASALAVGLAVNRWRVEGLRRVRTDVYAILPLATLFVVYWYSQLTSHLNIGHRHLLPVYPTLFIAVGVLGMGWRSRRWPFFIMIACLTGWQIGAAVRIAPHYLAYFNELAGGPEKGRYHLLDSSIDWGQDLPGLKTWIAEHAGAEPVYLAYFGTGEPAYYHLQARRLPFLNAFLFPVSSVKLDPGVYCISATILGQVYGPAGGTWSLRDEASYQKLRPVVENTDQSKISQQVIRRYDELRLARLCQYLRVRRPDGDVGYSIYIYRLTAEEIAAATAGSLSDWAALIERAKTATQ